VSTCTTQNQAVIWRGSAGTPCPARPIKMKRTWKGCSRRCSRSSPSSAKAGTRLAHQVELEVLSQNLERRIYENCRRQEDTNCCRCSMPGSCPTMYPTKTGQIVGNLSDIPFQFHVGNVNFPQVSTHPRLDNSDLTMMEISSTDGSSFGFFEVRDADQIPTPAKKRVDLQQIRHDTSLRSCSTNPTQAAASGQVRVRKRIGSSGAEGQEHVPAQHRGS